MKKKLLISTMILTLICIGCRNTKSDDLADNGEAAEDEYMGDIVEMTEEEKDFLCNIYSGDDRIRKGKLFSYQEETLRQYRFAKEYLNKKYPGYDIVFYGFSPKDIMNSVTRTGIRERDDEDGLFDMIIEGEDGNYTATDTFWGYLLRPAYDEALTEKLHEAGIENCITYTRFFGFFGPEVDGTMTVEEMFAHGTDMGMKRNTEILIDMEGGEGEETEMIKNQVEEVLRNVNQYGTHTVYFIPGILDECSSSEECGDYFDEHKRSDYYYIQFNTFDLRD